MNEESDERRLSPDAIVVRYVGGSHFDPGTGGINGSAFERTPKDVDGVSFARRGVHSTVVAVDRDAIRRVAASRLSWAGTPYLRNYGSALRSTCYAGPSRTCSSARIRSRRKAASSPTPRIHY